VSAPEKTPENLEEAEVIREVDIAPPPAQEVASTALVRRERRSEVIKPLDPDALSESFKTYQDLLPKLLDKDDIQEAGDGEQFVKKSGWRKIATAFDLDVHMIRSLVERDESGQPTRAEVWARAIAPSGRSMDGDGYCSADEKRFSGPRGNKSKLENDLRTTATTRAMNRAISGLVGMGAVSADEVDGPQQQQQGPKYGPAVAEQQLSNTRLALGYLLGCDPAANPVGVLLNQIEERARGYLPQFTLAMISLTAQAVKNRREQKTPPETAPDPALDAAAEEFTKDAVRAEQIAAEHGGMPNA
jgi:hypothetical protein